MSSEFPPPARSRPILPSVNYVGGRLPNCRRADPVTRIEGHAKITLQLDQLGRIAGARFHVVEFRGF